MQYIRTVETSSILSAAIKHQDADLIVEKLLLYIRKGQAPLICQHPDFGSEKFFKQFEAHCLARKNEMKNIMSVTDARYHLPMMYWSVWNPSPFLSQWCFKFFAENTPDGDSSGVRVAMQSFLAAALSASSRKHCCWIKPFLRTMMKTLIRFENREKASFHLPFPDTIVTEEVKHSLETLKLRVQNQTICYLDNPSLPIPASLLSVSLAEEGVVAEMSVEYVYIVLRLLTDNVADDTDDEGNTLLHLAASAGNKEIITIAVKSGASLTVANKAGCTPLDLASKRQPTISCQELQDACERNDTEAVKIGLCLAGNTDTYMNLKLFFCSL
jgi:hypothetical protein